MTQIATTERLQEALSSTLEDRGRVLQDLVSNNNALTKTMNGRGMMKPFDGDRIRESLIFAESETYRRHSGYKLLNPQPAEIINDAEFIPRMASVSITMANEDILRNMGTSQIYNLFETKIQAGETELKDRWVEDLHSDGTEDDQIGGLQLVLPTTVNTGTYGGISRADYEIWRTTTYDVDTYAWSSAATQFSETTAYSILHEVMIEHCRGSEYPDLILASKDHYMAYANQLTDIQRINDTNSDGAMGFTNLTFYGGGKAVPMVLEGGISSAMPDDTTYFIMVDALHWRYHPQRNFTPFGGRQMPVNQDAIVQHIGYMGELTMRNPLFMAKIYDSDTAS